LAGPLVYLVRRNILKKQHAEDGKLKMQPTVSKDNSVAYKDESRIDRSEGVENYSFDDMDVRSIYSLTEVYANNVVIQYPRLLGFSGDTYFNNKPVCMEEEG
jgi:hypothetical protein